MSYTGKFDYQYILEYIFSEKLELQQNRRIAVLLFDNKKMLSVIFQNEQSDIKQSETLIMRVKGKYYGNNSKVLSEEKPFDYLTVYNGGKYIAFIKVAVDTGSGNGVRILNMNFGIDKNTNEDLHTIFKMGEDFIMQEKITALPLFEALYPNSINTLRVVTYTTPD